MRKTIKKYFIPHADNNYHPHILHTKRAIFYGLVFMAAKIIVVAFVLLLPVEVFVLPDVLAEEQKQIIALTNELRKENNLPALAVAPKLDVSAQNKAMDMSENSYFAHEQDGKTLSYWLSGANYGYQTAGENLAVGFNTAKGIVNAWKNSPTHYANLLDTEYSDVGVGLSGGVYKDKPTIFIAQHLAQPLTIAKTPTPKKIASSPKLTLSAPPPETTKEITIPDNATSSVLAATANIAPPDVAETEPIIDTSAPTPIDKYIQAKKTLSSVTNLFDISQKIYFFAIIFFGLALLVNIFVEIRKQHPHVIAQTCGLLGLLVCLWVF